MRRFRPLAGDHKFIFVWPRVSISGSGLRLATAVGMSSVLLLALQWLFVFFSPQIIAAKPATDPALVTAWLRGFAYEHDGIEMPVALIGMFGFLGATAMLAWFSERGRLAFPAALICLAGFGAAAVVIMHTHTSEYSPPVEPASRFRLFVFGPVLLWLILWAQRRLKVRWHVLALATSAIVLVSAIILSMGNAGQVDYSYYLGPALRHIRGERLGAVYMQYDLLGTLIMEAMARLGLRLHEMQLVMALLFAAWYAMYWLLIRRLFRRPAIGLLLFVGLILVRFLNINGHPTIYPQVLPHRLDMWVPLLLLAYRWGLDSFKTSVAFALAYALNATFGLLCGVVYVIAIVIQGIARPQRMPAGALARHVAKRCAPLALVAVFQKLVFGSVISSSAAYFVGLQLGFLPISRTSLFWPIALFLGWAMAVFVLNRHERSSRYGLLICLFAVMHLTYFFGRSSDHNLLNLSSVWLFPIFLALDQAAELGRLAAPIGGTLLLIFAFMGTQQAASKVAKIGDRLQRGVWIDEHPIEKTVDGYRVAGTPNTMIIELDDVYYNYRLGWPQRGFFTPFHANVLVEETALLLDNALDSGLLLLTVNPEMQSWIDDLNRASVLKERGHGFAVYPRPGQEGFFEIVRAERK